MQLSKENGLMLGHYRSHFFELNMMAEDSPKHWHPARSQPRRPRLQTTKVLKAAMLEQAWIRQIHIALGRAAT